MYQPGKEAPYQQKCGLHLLINISQYQSRAGIEPIPSHTHHNKENEVHYFCVFVSCSIVT